VGGWAVGSIIVPINVVCVVFECGQVVKAVVSDMVEYLVSVMASPADVKQTTARQSGCHRPTIGRPLSEGC
jgi:hypothetical protein